MKQKVKQNKKVAKKPVAKQEEEVINEAELLQEEQPQQEEAPVVEPMAVEEEGDNEELVDEEMDGGEDNDDDAEVDEDEDDEPTESAIEKEEPTIPSKVKSGPIAENVPHDRIVHVNKLPKQCKLVDIIEVFAEYGAIDAVHIQEGTVDSTANVAFKNPKAATKALAANKKSVKGSTILVTKKQVSGKKTAAKAQKEKTTATAESRERSVYVKFLKRGTTEEQLKEHFASCGEVEQVKVILKNSITFAFVTFTDKAVVQTALKLHNSLLNGNTIGVFESSVDAANQMSKRDPELTVMLKNTQNLEGVEGDKLQSIFAKCGEIESMDVVCRKTALAFITFKNKEAVEKAFKLSGKTVNDINLEVVAYNPDKQKTSIFIINIAKDVTEEDLKNHFAKSGEISAVILRKGFAVIHFMDSDGYCKSFLQNETMLKGQMIFLEPHSIKKRMILKPKHHHNKGKKRSGQSNGVFDAKRVKSA